MIWGSLKMPTLSIWNKKLGEKQIHLTLLGRQKEKITEERLVKEEEVLVKEEAQSILQTAAQLTQSTLGKQLNSVVSLALAAVFQNNPYKFIVNFEKRRNATECDLLFERNKEILKPLSDSGFGAADIASTALRIAYWSSGETRPLLLIDEPCKNLSRDYHGSAATMFKELCAKLKLQMIVVTHIPDFRERCNKMFLVKMDGNGKSTVKEN